MTIVQMTWKLIRFRTSLFTLNLICSSVYYCLPLTFGFLMSLFFDVLTGDAAVDYNVTTICVLLIVTELSHLSTFILYTYVWNSFRYPLVTLLRKNVFERILKSSNVSSIRSAPGEVVNRLRDDVDGCIGYIEAWIDLSSNVLCMGIAISVLLYVNPYVTMIVFVPMLVTIPITRIMGDRLKNYNQAHRDSSGQVSSFLVEVFGSIQAVKNANAQSAIVSHASELNEIRSKNAVKDRVFFQLIRSFNSNTVDIATGIMLLVISQSMQSGSFTVGDFALFVNYMSWVMGFPAWAGKLLARSRQVEISYKRLVELLEGDESQTLITYKKVYLDGKLPDIPDVLNSPQQRLSKLEISGLTYAYPTSGRGIHNINISLSQGTLTVITGRIGAGKTTLLMALLGLIPAQSGKVIWNGKIIKDPASFFIPPHTAYTPQAPTLFTGTLRENILLGLSENKVNLDSAVQSSGLDLGILNCENGLDTLVGYRGVKLSGGQIQRTAAARMFVREPELLVIDDLSSALDVETERTIWKNWFERQSDGVKKTTCIVVSHRRSVLKQADHIVVMQKGRVRAEGQIDNLLKSSDEMRKLWYFGSKSV